ncbi:Uncharacterized protein MCB1EB_0117 [Mycoavidus cysteinexigens]|uniref:Uncharacterized protein n=1 Tax=Mycoavidus cysteinexigens TaxID=1553431 RepID=A0A2Z6ESB9_9BURK|nr:hypothetical protein [Mycoavidus cysteinexigens]BBE08278.1 Uncharacterized protein MCB1EB_0117 [Mycoavidus cysteinexigens]GAM53019.1 hypothetical protein EBME_1482 [bacterium endosymbiont of Mortierella elongata FMR23-6]GLR02168.1 hypothetical protein GCM10007934_19820 [Mycoavidus cysteinexigens]
MIEIIQKYQNSIAGLIAIAGWIVTYQLNVLKDRKNKQRDLITAHLLDAYRKLESASSRGKLTENQIANVESAIADIQIFGSKELITAIEKFMVDFMLNKNIDLSGILGLLREDVRSALHLPRTNSAVRHFRL